ncbi:hypothetical protein K1T71_001018 [Dendrolimus kikuchii]|uniref:Uncharacterized protein n=1 Tax=Dendrolimus kikuchii TaxID=765133 RepID=A0ACC1DHE7_9NEOP|nr:hypothetical protein K1T71_001018 [Dendrolimus kikuchii]
MLKIKGLLHTEYLSYIPQSYIYYSSGRRSKIQIWGLRENARLCAISCLHVHLVGPALGVVLVSSLDFGLDYRLVKGIILSCVGGPCSWLSLALCTSDYAASVVALNYLSTLIAEPLAMIILCGRATVPPLGGIISTILTTATPFLIGVTVKRYSGDTCTTKLCACLLAYMSCCQLLAKSGGLLTTHYVLVTIVIEFCWLVMSAGTCWLYVRCGLLKEEQFQTLAMCSIPKSLEYGWQSTCRPPGLSSLPSVFLAPAQAILLAAMAGDDDNEYAFGDNNDGDEQRQISMQ